MILLLYVVLNMVLNVVLWLVKMFIMFEYFFLFLNCIGSGNIFDFKFIFLVYWCIMCCGISFLIDVNGVCLKNFRKIFFIRILKFD